MTANNQVLDFDSSVVDEIVEKIGVTATACKEKGNNPFEAIDIVRESRLGAVRVPLAEGGSGWSMPQYFDMLMRLAAADSDVAQILRAHFWFTEERLRSPDQSVRKRWLSRVVAGEIFGNAATEIGGSSAIGSFVMNTTLTPAENGYILDGTKYYCTGSLFSDWVMVLASTPEGGTTNVVVPVKRDGVTLEDDWDGVGQRFTGSGTGHFKQVHVNEEEVLWQMGFDEENTEESPTEPYFIGQFVQLILTATIVGNMKRASQEAAEIVRSRKRSFTHASEERPAADPQFQEIVGRIAAATFAAESAVLAAATAQQKALDTVENGLGDFDLTHRASLLSAQAKVFADDVAPKLATQLFELGGASSTVRERGLDTYWRNIVTLAAHNATAFKARAVGDTLVNGVELPMNAYF
ncbi:MAG: acyl-CoA dehydrogenase family protein [Pseudomonadota bacterium]